jgi:Restriction endonuclease
MALDPAEVTRLLDEALAAENTDAKGKAFERLAVYLFEAVPGTIVVPDVRNPLQTEQVDVAVGNLKFDNGLQLLPHAILVECKLTDENVESRSVGYFLGILDNRRVELGVLMTLKGITGDRADLTNAHALGVAANVKGTRLVVITRDDILGLQSAADFVELLHRRYLLALASGGVGVPDK